MRIKPVSDGRHEDLVEEGAGEQLHESDTRFRNILENSSDIILTVNTRGDITYVTPSIQRLGYTPDEVVDKSFQILIPEPDRPELLRMFSSAVQNGVNENIVQVDVLKKDGSTTVIEVNVSPLIVDEKNSGFICVFRDVSLRTKYQKRVEALRVASERSRLDYVHELEEKNVELGKLDELKNRFISMVTHEIRSPLISIKGYADFIISGHVGKVNHETGGMLDVIKRNADRIMALSTDLADTQVIESGHIRLDTGLVHMGDLVMIVVDEIQPLLDARKQILVKQVPSNLSTVLADETRLIQVMVNLLDNACKFSLEGQEIFLEVLEEEGHIKVRVTDSGLGIGEEDLSKLFEPFPDIEKPSNTKGTGLGLSICKGILDLHGGKIWAESSGLGKGSTFSFMLPVVEEES